MKPNTCFVVDVWEGQLEIDEAALKAGGVAGMSIRINDMNGGHHKDAGFEKQWREASGFVRFPYFVYNPWVNGKANYDWLVANMPNDAKSVAVDIEVKYANYPPATYAGEVNKFLALCKPLWKTIIYTAEWFLPCLSKWPAVDYWWAQYPSGSYYFPNVTTWEGLKVAVEKLDKPFNVFKVPGALKLWQFSGDFLTLPGTTRKIDVNLFYGTEAELAAYFGTSVVEVVEPEPEPVPVPVDPGLEPEPVPTVVSGLYTFAKSNFYARRGGGPLTLPMTRSRGKLGDNISRYQWSVLAVILRALNSLNKAALDLISAPDWGPSKGLEGDYIKWIGLLWPGRNIVRVAEIVSGWGRVEGAAMYESGKYNAIDNPDKVHMVYDYHVTNGWCERAKPVYVPILGGGWWVDMQNLVSVDSQLPKRVTVTCFPALIIREKPSINSAMVGRKISLQSMTVLEVVIATGGIWGRIAEGWVALRHQGKNLTDWKI